MSFDIELIERKEQLEQDFLQSCQTLKKKSKLFRKIVHVKINWNKNELTCLPSVGLKRGDILFDHANKFSIKITFIAKNQIKYPNTKLSSNDCILLDLCNFKRVKEA